MTAHPHSFQSDKKENKNNPMIHQGRAIHLTNITKQWAEVKALDDVSITITKGSFTALLGPSGCGKSTLLRIIAGLESASDGTVVIGDKDVTNTSPDKRDLSMVFQSYALFPHLSVAENIIFGLKTRRVPKAERDEKLAKTADLLGLTPYLDRKPSELSGGQQQRVALGRAVIAERSICLMDEPLSNLDAKLRHEMRVELRALQQKLGFTMVYVTHDQAEAITMADQVVLLNGGKVEQIDSPRDLYARPQTPFAARFIGTPPMSVFSASVWGELGEKIEQELATECRLGLRPEDVSVISDPATPSAHLTGNRLSLPATVLGQEYLGADCLLTCKFSQSEAATAANGSEQTNDLIVVRASGDFASAQRDIHLSFPLEKLALFDAKTNQRLTLQPALLQSFFF